MGQAPSGQRRQRPAGQGLPAATPGRAPAPGRPLARLPTRHHPRRGRRRPIRGPGGQRSGRPWSGGGGRGRGHAAGGTRAVAGAGPGRRGRPGRHDRRRRPRRGGSPLEELRLAVLENRIEADLALGRQAEVTSELRALVAEHAQADALAAYQQSWPTSCGASSWWPRTPSSPPRSPVASPGAPGRRPGRLPAGPAAGWPRRWPTAYGWWSWPASIRVPHGGIGCSATGGGHPPGPGPRASTCRGPPRSGARGASWPRRSPALPGNDRPDEVAHGLAHLVRGSQRRIGRRVRKLLGEARLVTLTGPGEYRSSSSGWVWPWPSSSTPPSCAPCWCRPP